jgi:hypothetical protein
MFKNAVVAIVALFTLGLPAAAQEPTRTERTAILLADVSWSETDVTEYIALVSTREGRAGLLPVTTDTNQCERQVAALDNLRLRLQAHPEIGDQLTEYRLTGMREHAVELGACDGVVAQIDRLSVVRRTLAATSTAIAVDPTNRSRAEALISDASWSESDVTEYIYLVTTRTGRAVLLPATTQGDECERQVAALDNFRLRLQAHPQIIESLTEERLAEMRADALGVGACRGVGAQIDRITTVRRTLAATVIAVAPAPEECTVINWRWDNPVCNSPSSANKAIDNHFAFVSQTATQCQISTVWRLSRSQGWDAGVFMARHYLDMRFDGRVLDESVCGPTPVVAQRPAPAQPAAPPPPPVPPTSDEIAEDLSDESWRYQADELRPGHPLYDVEMRADCSVYYRGVFVQPASAEEGSDGQCSVLPIIVPSPSGRWIAVHSPLSDYGYEQISFIDTLSQTVPLRSHRMRYGRRLHSLKIWSEDETFLYMYELTYLPPFVGGLAQLTFEFPCEFSLPRASLGCVDENRFSRDLQAAALRASPLARCLPERSCYLVMDISEPRFEAGELAYTGTVQLKTIDGAESGISETFVPGEDIVWFEFSGRGARNTDQDFTFRVLDPAVQIIRP